MYGLSISDESPLTDIDLYRYARELKINNFRGVYMHDNLPKVARSKECGIVNFNTSEQSGSHWVCYYKDGMKIRIYFDWWD